MSLLRRGAALAFAGVTLPSVLLAAPASKGPVSSKNPAEAAHSPVEAGTTASSVVTDEMRSANEAATNSAEAAIASLKAARAAIAAEKSKEGATPATPPASSLPESPAPAAPQKKGKPVERLDPPPDKQVPAASHAEASAAHAASSGSSAVIDASAAHAQPDTKGNGQPAPQGAPPPEAHGAQPSAAAAATEPAKPAPQDATATPPPQGAPPSVEAAAVAAGTSATGEPAATGEVKKKSRFGSDDALGDAAKKKGKGKAKETVKLTPEQQKAAEIKAFCDKARDAIRRGEEEVARGLLESLVAVDLPHAEKRIALTEVASVYEEKGDLTKAIAILEKLTTVLEGDTEVPAWLLKLGQLYREAGAYQMAISRYYGVIQLAMKVGSSDFQRFQAISRQAQREIANTYFIKGDFDQAQKFYNMALRSDLPKDERGVALFRAAHCTFMRNDMKGAINGLERFLKDYSRHASAAEARYMLATAYRIEGRPQDAYDSVIDLLRDAKGKSEENPKAWAFWQKKAGNEFANDYYQRGEFVNAVTIYQALAAIEESPEWRWPVVYQMGLCFERLRIEPRAAECYKYIVDENKRPEFRWRKMPQSVANLVQMASWRVDQLDWDGKLHAKLRAVAGADLNRPLPRGVRP
jgi:tetratricopeptide (TPR) repeat protein